MQIRIRHYTFSLSEPYQPGHQLTPGEAQALNSLRAENIRNNFTRAVADEVASLPEGELLSAETQASLQAKLDQYASRYQFVFRHVPRAQLGPIDREALTLAEERVRARHQFQGAEVGELQIRQEIENEAGSAEVQQLARTRVAARQAIADTAIEELL